MHVPLAVTLVQFEAVHVPFVCKLKVLAHPVHMVDDEQLLQFDGQAVQFGAVEAYPGAH